MKTTMKKSLSRGALALACLTLALSLGGCSWFRRQKPQTAQPLATEMPAPAPPALGEPGATPGSEPTRPMITSEPVDFPEESGVSDVRFDYDRSDIRSDQLAALDRNLKYFQAHPEVKIMIEGHADERGSVEYNFALGQRRAAAVQEYLLKNGIAAERLATISKGKEQPLDPAHNEAAYAKNRRVHFMRFQ